LFFHLFHQKRFLKNGEKGKKPKKFWTMLSGLVVNHQIGDFGKALGVQKFSLTPLRFFGVFGYFEAVCDDLNCYFLNF